MLIDVDVLLCEEGIGFVFGGVVFCGLDECCVFIWLVLGGGDVVEVCEFDVENCCFVVEGFCLLVVKLCVIWCDDDLFFVVIDFGFDLLMCLGYLCVVKFW